MENNNTKRKKFIPLMPPSKSSKLQSRKIEKLDLENRSVENSYEIQGEVASGGMGKIYQVFDQKLHRKLAMKVLKINDNQKIKQHFVEEALLTAQLQHPNIVPLHDIGLQSDGNLFFTMKLLSGEDVGKIIDGLKEQEEVDKYELHNMLIIFRKVCDAVAFAHSRGVTHCDIKPDNIMVGEYGEVLLMDWGLAKFVGEDRNIQGKKYIAGVIYSFLDQSEKDAFQGTPSYMSPEQACGMLDMIDARTDVYLLGATLYHMLTFSAPHQGHDLTEVLTSAVEGSFILPQQRSNKLQIPLELCRIITKAMSQKKQDRYQKVEEMAKDIDNFMSGHLVSNPICFRKGEVLIRQGDEGDKAYYINKGSVDVYKQIGDQNLLLATMGAGNIIGEMSLISSEKRSADVVAKENMEVQVIDQNLLDQALSKVPDWIEKLMSNLVKRLQAANENVHILKIREPVYHILNQLGMLGSLLANNSGSSLQNFPLEISAIATEISAILSISKERVEEVLKKFSQTEICKTIDEQNFKIVKTEWFYHLLKFLCSVLEVEQGVSWHTPPEAIDSQTRQQILQIAASLSEEVKKLISDVSKQAR